MPSKKPSPAPAATTDEQNDPVPFKLTPKQARFVEEYLVDLNAHRAALRAGYAPAAADAMGRETYALPTVRAAIDAARAARSERTKINADWVLTRLAREADADIADLYDAVGNLLPLTEWPREFRQGLVTGFESVSENVGTRDEPRPITVRKLKLLDRSRTIELIGKHVGVQAFREKFALVGPDGGAVQVARVERIIVKPPPTDERPADPDS